MAQAGVRLAFLTGSFRPTCLQRDACRAVMRPAPRSNFVSLHLTGTNHTYGVRTRYSKLVGVEVDKFRRRRCVELRRCSASKVGQLWLLDTQILAQCADKLARWTRRARWKRRQLWHRNRVHSTRRSHIVVRPMIGQRLDKATRHLVT